MLRQYRCKGLRISLGVASSRSRSARPPPIGSLLSWYSPPSQTLHSNDGRRFSASKDDKVKATPSAWQQLKSPPNVITLTRMASTPILAYWILTEQHTLAIWGCTFAALSDALDGYLAKNYNMATTVGTYLDPVSDKVLINGLAISLWYSGILPTPLIVVWAVKDIGLLSGTAWMLYQNHNSINFFTTSLTEKPLKVEPTTIAKANTALQFATLGVGIISPVSSFPPMVLDGLCWVTGGTSVASVLSYAGKSAIKSSAEGSKDGRKSDT